jgi:hypothetical protein
MAASKGTYWFWSDWLGDQEVRRLSPAERGLWIDLLALAAVSNPVGYVCDDRGRPLSHDDIRRVTNAASIEEVAELIDGILKKGAASRDRTGRIFNRRMVRDAELSAKRKRSGKLGGERTALLWRDFKVLPRQVVGQVPGHDEPTPTNPKSKTTSSESVAAREGPSEGVASPHLARLIRKKWG